MKTILRPAVTLLVLLTLITGVAYPLAVSGAAKLLPRQADGGLILQQGRVVGSELVGQAFTHPGYFWGRPSATAAFAYDASASNASNLGPSNPALADAVKQRVEALRAADPDQSSPVPIDLVTTSASGLDPDISPAAAYYQVHRVAKARGLDEEKVKELVHARIEDRTLGVLGEPRVNVLRLNLALDALAGGTPHSPRAEK